MTKPLCILLSSDHAYPMATDQGVGLNPKDKPSGSGQHLHDLLALGLSECGHRVYYHLPEITQPLPKGVEWVREPYWDVDIVHLMSPRNRELRDQCVLHGVPTVVTCHLDWRHYESVPLPDNWIYVSRGSAYLHGSDRFVHNGLDPNRYCYRRTKEDYFLFMTALDCALDKGLDQALSLSTSSGVKLVVAGTGSSRAAINTIQRRCAPFNAELVGDVQGRHKAQLLARAKALLLPSQLQECGSLVLIEAQLSGTPVICSDAGACAEMVDSDVGFVCKTPAEYRGAVERLHLIDPAICRQTAIRRFHYKQMTKNYLREYAKEISVSVATDQASDDVSPRYA